MPYNPTRHSGDHDWALGQMRRARVQLFNTVADMEAEAQSAQARFAYVVANQQLYWGRDQSWVHLTGGGGSSGGWGPPVGDAGDLPNPGDSVLGDARVVLNPSATIFVYNGAEWVDILDDERLMFVDGSRAFTGQPSIDVGEVSGAPESQGDLVPLWFLTRQIAELEGLISGAVETGAVTTIADTTITADFVLAPGTEYDGMTLRIVGTGTGADSDHTIISHTTGGSDTTFTVATTGVTDAGPFPFSAVQVVDPEQNFATQQDIADAIDTHETTYDHAEFLNTPDALRIIAEAHLIRSLEWSATGVPVSLSNNPSPQITFDAPNPVPTAGGTLIVTESGSGNNGTRQVLSVTEDGGQVTLEVTGGPWADTSDGTLDLEYYRGYDHADFVTHSELSAALEDELSKLDIPEMGEIETLVSEAVSTHDGDPEAHGGIVSLVAGLAAGAGGHAGGGAILAARDVIVLADHADPVQWFNDTELGVWGSDTEVPVGLCLRPASSLPLYAAITVTFDDSGSVTVPSEVVDSFHDLRGTPIRFTGTGSNPGWFHVTGINGDDILVSPAPTNETGTVGLERAAFDGSVILAGPFPIASGDPIYTDREITHVDTTLGRVSGPGLARGVLPGDLLTITDSAVGGDVVGLEIDWVDHDRDILGIRPTWQSGDTGAILSWGGRNVIIVDREAMAVSQADRIEITGSGNNDGTYDVSHFEYLADFVGAEGRLVLRQSLPDLTESLGDWGLIRRSVAGLLPGDSVGDPLYTAAEDPTGVFSHTPLTDALVFAGYEGTIAGDVITFSPVPSTLSSMRPGDPVALVDLSDPEEEIRVSSTVLSVDASSITITPGHGLSSGTLWVSGFGPGRRISVLTVGGEYAGDTVTLSGGGTLDDVTTSDWILTPAGYQEISGIDTVNLVITLRTDIGITGEGLAQILRSVPHKIGSAAVSRPSAPQPFEAAGAGAPFYADDGETPRVSTTAGRWVVGHKDSDHTIFVRVSEIP